MEVAEGQDSWGEEWMGEWILIFCADALTWMRIQFDLKKRKASSNLPLRDVSVERFCTLEHAGHMPNVRHAPPRDGGIAFW